MGRPIRYDPFLRPLFSDGSAPATRLPRLDTYQKSMEPFPFKSAGLSAQAAALRPVLATERREQDAGLSQSLEKQSISTNAADETFGAAPGHFTVEL